MLKDQKSKSIKKFNDKDEWIRTSFLFDKGTYWSIHTIDHKKGIDPDSIPKHKWRINVGSEKYIKGLWRNL